MKTKCIVLGEEQKKEERKPIEFVNMVYLEMNNSCLVEYNTGPDKWENIELIKSSPNNNFDLIFAYDKDRTMGVLYLGHWNDGFVKED